MKNNVIMCIAGLALCLSGIVVAGEKNSHKSDGAFAFLSVDIDKTPGWVAHVKGGYEWKLFRGYGVDITDGTNKASAERNAVEKGVAGTVFFGYNLSPKIPLSVGVELGYGPHGELHTNSTIDGNPFYMKQRVSMYVLDMSLDYEFKKCDCAKLIPFIGVTGGLATVKQKAHGAIETAAGVLEGKHGKRERFNLMGGARTGIRYKVNDRITLSAYGSYNYLGKVPGKHLALTDGATTYTARTKDIKVHSLSAQAGLKISF